MFNRSVDILGHYPSGGPRVLGRSGLVVSAFGLATMAFGGRTREADALRQMDIALDAGISLFATADDCPPLPRRALRCGVSQKIVGKWLATRSHRSRVVLSSRGDLQHRGGSIGAFGQPDCSARASIIIAVDETLQRLRTDYLDLLELRWARPSADTPLTQADIDDEAMIDEMVSAIGTLIAAGKVREVGLSNEAPWAVKQLLGGIARGRVRPVAAVQHSYNLLDRSFDHEMSHMAVERRLGLIAASPLAAGVLTGKYIDGGLPTAGTRLARIRAYDGGALFEEQRRTVALYADLASEFGVGLTHMALAFVAAQPFTASVLIGASNFGQLESNLGAIDLRLSNELIAAINAIHVGGRLRHRGPGCEGSYRQR